MQKFQSCSLGYFQRSFGRQESSDGNSFLGIGQFQLISAMFRFKFFYIHLEVMYIADELDPNRFESKYLILEKIKLVTIQFINDSVGMSIATSAIAFYIPVGIMCILYSQVSVVEILISSNRLWTLSVYSFVDIPTNSMNLSFIFHLRYIWLWKNEPEFYNLWMVSKKNLNKIFYQHNEIGKNQSKIWMKYRWLICFRKKSFFPD